MLSAGNVGGTSGSNSVSSAADVLGYECGAWDERSWCSV